MSDIGTLEELLAQLRNTKDEVVAGQRDLLLEGGDYPEPEVRLSLPIEGEVELLVGRTTDLPVRALAGELASTLDRNIIAVIVIGARSTGLANAFEMLVQLGAGDDFLDEADPKDERYVSLVGFFDHEPGEHDEQHDIDERGLARASGVFGHYHLDASRALKGLAKRAPDLEPVVRLSLVASESHLNADASLVIADLAFAIVVV